MARDPDMVAHLRRLLATDPTDAGARLQLASALMADDPAAALAEARRVLEARPTDGVALHLAAEAAQATGADDAASGYRRLLDALGVAGPGERVPVDVGAGPEALLVEGDEPDEFDRFLADVMAEDARHRVTLDDVGGMDDVKSRLQTSFLAPMRNAALRAAFGSRLRGGLLLYGPPGCGKTFLARAVAGELGAHFVSVGLHDVLDMWLGSSERNLHQVFERARHLAPCVVFLDEVDALGQKRSHLTHSAGRNVVVQLLTELDSLAGDNDGVFVLGATNAPWDLDPALRRPGRFDRTLLVLPPDPDARVSILGYHLRDKPVADHVDLTAVAARTERFSGADLALVCDAAAEIALGESVTAGVVRPITGAHLETALAGVRPSTSAWFDAARNVAMFANADGDYDDLLAWMRDHGI